jgi:hypothetical protein
MFPHIRTSLCLFAVSTVANCVFLSHATVYCPSQMQSQGRDVSDFYPDVVRNVIVRAVLRLLPCFSLLLVVIRV